MGAARKKVSSSLGTAKGWEEGTLHDFYRGLNLLRLSFQMAVLVAFSGYIAADSWHIVAHSGHTAAYSGYIMAYSRYIMAVL